MKKILRTSLTIITSMVLILVVLIFVFPKTSLLKKETLSIALMAPMTGYDRTTGEAMSDGAKLYVEQLNKGGGIRGRKVNLKIEDDRSDKRTAMEAAYRVGSEKSEVLLVIGHLYSTLSIDAGKVYKKMGIPAITPYATAGSVTAENEWYFRTTPNNEMQITFVVNYMSKILRQKSASIVFVDDAYGRSLADGFESAARKSNVTITKKWGVSSEDEDQIKQVIGKIRATKDPGMIFLATYGRQAVEIISSVKYPGAGYSIIGTEVLSDISFLENLKKLPKEQSSPGYHSDGIHATATFLMSIGGEEAYRFRDVFLQKYGKEPLNASIYAYDAMHVAVEAIRRAEVQGKDHIRSDRRKVRDALAGFHSLDTAIRGVTGHIFFNETGDLIRPPAMGVYKKQQFIPSFSQYLLSDLKETEGLLEKTLTGEIIELKDVFMKRSHVVYVGVGINEIRNLDIKNASYTLDFHIWFRYEGEFDDTKVKFMNALKPVKLEQPIKEEKRGDATVRIHHLVVDFKSSFDFHAYPFEDHILRLRLHHDELTRDQLIFVADYLEMPDSTEQIKNAKLDAATGWTVKDISFYEDIINTASPLGDAAFLESSNKTSYSRLNTAIRIQRIDQGVILKTLLPIIVMIVILYTVHFIPPDRLGARLVIFMGVLVANTHYHMRLFSDLPVAYVSVMGYAFLTVYIFAATSVLLSVSGYVLEQRGHSGIARILGWSARIGFIAASGGAMTYLIM